MWNYSTIRCYGYKRRKFLSRQITRGCQQTFINGTALSVLKQVYFRPILTPLTAVEMKKGCKGSHEIMSMTRSLFIARKREERWVIAGEREGRGGAGEREGTRFKVEE